MNKQYTNTELVNFAKEAALEASKYIMTRMSLSEIKIDYKTSSKDLVTHYDIESEKIIKQTIFSKDNSFNFFGEEEFSKDFNANIPAYREKLSKGIWFIIDPIDGTTNFSHGIPMFAISIGIMRDNTIVGGVIYDPNRDEMFEAEINCGAKLNNVKINTSPVNSTDRAVVLTSLRILSMQNNPSTINFYNELINKTQSALVIGSAAIDLAWIACGRVESLITINLAPWDIAAGVIIIKEAGGLVGDSNFDLFSKLFYASNGKIHGDITQIAKLLESPEKAS